MSIIAEIESKKEIILDTASRREIYFYNFLKNEALIYPNDEDLTDEDQIFYSAFSIDGPNKLELVKKCRQRKAVKGLSYNKNLLSLCAFAKYDADYEKNNLVSYFNKYSSKEQYILSLFFPAFCSLGEIDNKNNIDIVIKDIIINKDIAQWNRKITEAIKSASDVIDIFIIEQAFLVATDFHPVNLDNEALYKVCNYVEGKYLKFWSIWFFIICTLALIVIAFVLIKYWDIAEPLVYAISLFIVIIVAACSIYFSQSPDEIKNNILKKIRIKLIKRLYEKIGLDYELAQELKIRRH